MQHTRYGGGLKDLAFWGRRLTNFLDWEVGMIKKAEGGYKVLSENGKNLGGP
jgi:hypothetical protein